MNIDQAKCIPISEILILLNCKQARANKTDGTYFSPLRDEKTASFHVNYSKNIWYDHGIGKGGDVIALVRCYLNSQNENDTVVDALRWLRNMTGNVVFIAPIIDHLPQEIDEKKLIVKSAKPLQHLALSRYLESRGISLPLANSIIKEVRVLNKETNKTIFAIGLENEESGFEIRNSFFKGCAGTKAITFIRGRVVKPKAIHLFEGMMDYLSYLTILKRHHDEDVIILNSLSCLKEATPYIKNYGYQVAYSWTDNDKAGQKARIALQEFFDTEENIRHRPMNDVYAPHKDVNAWHMHNLNLSL